MAATITILDNSSPEPSLFHITTLSSLTFFIFLTFFFLIFTILKISNSNCSEKQENPVKIQSLPVINDDENKPGVQIQENCEPDPENMTRSLLVEVLPSNSPKWDTLLSKSEDFDDDPDEKPGSGQEEKKMKKKRVKKKKSDPIGVDVKLKEELVCSYPFTKSCSATQRKIKQQYEQLVKSHGPNGLTLDQVGQFVNCLVESRNELQTKSDIIKRRFTIFKALLCKADRSSYDRIRQQIYKLELEQKKLEEDAFVYNRLQAQIKASPAYKKMVEIVETKANSSSLEESTDSEFSDISFEDFLAQEKKDAFWQKNGRLRPCSG